MGKKSNKKKSRDGKGLEMNGESRFDSSKPQFRLQKEKSSKVVLDERFVSVLTDPRFQVEVKDKYGRKKKRGTKDDLKAFYTIEQEEKEKKGITPPDKESSSSSDDAHEETEAHDSGRKNENEEDPSSRIAYLTALSRGEIDVSSSSEDDGTEDEDDGTASEVEGDEEDPVMGAAGVLDPSAREQDEIIMTDEPSPYLAVTNMDWHHVRAVDVFAIVASFSPPGAVRKVQVFVSDFGQERLALEEKAGPQGIWKQRKDNSGKQKASAGSQPDEDENEAAVDAGEDDISQSALAMENDEDESDYEQGIGEEYIPEEDKVDKDFDPEKLRAYEASKLRYYFAVVELASPELADIAYKEVDGMEFEHSSAAVDLRSIPKDEIDNVTKNRPMRDEACSLPSNYVPPEFIVSALQQTNVQCTWEEGDRERDRTLTKYGSTAWESMAESDDLKAYLASDVSSDEEDSKVQSKASKLRQMLGLESDEGGNEDIGDSVSGPESDSDESTGVDNGKVASFVPGQSQLKDKIKAKLASKDEAEDLTPWQKYQEKRKLKRRERRQAMREKRKEVNQIRSGEKDSNVKDDFFVSESNAEDQNLNYGNKSSQTKEQLELLVAGEENEEDARDFDIRGIQRMEKNKDKKLRGSRKRKEDALALNVSGTDFKVNVKDERFKAVLDGEDKFGIDPTDPNFKETPGMKEIMSEQSRRRKAKRRKQNPSEPAEAIPDVSADSTMKQSKGSAALSALVRSIKTKVTQ